MINELAQHVIKRHDSLKSGRGTWENHWQEVLELTLPRKSDIVTTHQTPGAKKTARMFDSTAAIACADLAAGLVAAIAPPERPWFMPRVWPRKLEQVRRVHSWRWAVREGVLDALRNSNFLMSLNEAALDLTTIGTANVLSEELPIEQAGFNGLAFQSMHIAEYMIDEDARGYVDTVSRKYELTARQAAQMFGMDALPEKVRKCLVPDTGGTAKPDEKHWYIHQVFPAGDPQMETFKLRTRLPVASVTVCVEDKSVVRQAGFHEMPFHTPRWSKGPREIYGRSPAMLSLPDIKTLNLIVRYGLEALPLALYPPFLIKEGTLASGQLQLTPGAQNHWDGRLDDKPTQIDWRGRPEIENAKEAEYRTMIMRGLHSDRLRLKESPQMTATEVLERRAELLRMLGPTVDRLRDELIEPLVERVIMMMLRAGALPPPPPELGQPGVRIEVEFTGPLANAARLDTLRAYSDWWTLNERAISMNPAVLDNIDMDYMGRLSGDVVGLPPEALVDERIVAQTRKARAQAQQQAGALNNELEVRKVAAQEAASAANTREAA